MGGLVIGYGVRDNIAEAYEWLMEHYRHGDKIYIFGFSRGACAPALALAGMLRTVGLLSPGAENLVPYAPQALPAKRTKFASGRRPAEDRREKKKDKKVHGRPAASSGASSATRSS